MRNETSVCHFFAEINLPFTTKQYKNDNIFNFVYLWENSRDSQSMCSLTTWRLDRDMCWIENSLNWILFDAPLHVLDLDHF